MSESRGIRDVGLSVPLTVPTCALCGNACHVMMPSLMADSSAATALALGQCKFIPGGQSKKRDMRYDCEQDRFQMSVIQPP